MVNIFNRKIKLNTETTSDELGGVKKTNTTYANGFISGDKTPFIETSEFLGENHTDSNDSKEVRDFWSYLSVLNNWHQDKFNWEINNTKIDKIILEQWLFNYGELVAFKDAIGEIVLMPFIVETWDMYGEPKKVTPISVLESKNSTKFKTVHIGENAITIRHNVRSRFNNTISSGDFYKLWFKLKDAAFTRNSIYSATQLSISRLLLGGDIDSIMKSNIDKILDSSSPTLNVDAESMRQILQGKDGKLNIIELDGKISDRWINLTNFLNDAARVVGAPYDSNSQKKERKNVDETNLHNNLGNSILRTQFSLREHGVKKINEMFNVNWSVKWNEDFTNEIDLLGEVENITEKKEEKK